MRSTMFITPIVLTLCFLSGCHTNAPQLPGADPVQPDNSVQVLRWMDSAGLTHNDERMVTSADEISRLKSYFPDINSSRVSPVHGSWVTLIILHFRSADGSETYITTDYRLYRVNKGQTGDFVVNPGFSDEIDRLFGTTAAAP